MSLKPSLPWQPLRSDEFLPPIHRWTMIAGLILVSAVSAAAVLASVVKYNVAVKATATVRPVGDLRVVQSAIGGTVEQIAVQVNQSVQQGAVIARLDDTPFTTQQRQQQGTIQQLRIQLAQLETQIQLMEVQIQSESRAIDQAVTAAQAEVSRTQQDYQERQAITQADLTAAQAALTLAESEMERYQQLVASGAISQLQLEEKQAAVQAAAAQVQRVAALEPANSSVQIAQQQVAQATSSGQATIASLRREQELLIQNRADLQSQLLLAQQDLQQVEANLANTVIRAAVDGRVFQLNLRNPNQVVQAGEVIAEIAQTTPLQVNAQVATQDIDRVQPGQVVQLRIDACPYSEYGTLPGTVASIAPDAVTPQNQSATRSSYFAVTIRPDSTVLKSRTRSCQILPGMQAEATIIAQQETFLQFLLRKIAS